MRALLTSALLQASDQDMPNLAGLLQFAVTGRHDILVEPEARGPWEAWLSRRDGFYADLWRRAELDSQQRQSLTPSSAEVRVIDGVSYWGGVGPPVLTIDDAISLLQLPLEILVEDETSDGLFLERTVPGPLRRKWRELVAKGSIRLLTLGGITNVDRRLHGRHFQNPSYLFRSFVLVDSDTPTRWQRIKDLGTDVRKARASALRYRVRIHILLRRMSESYIPPEGLQAWAAPRNDDARRHAEAFSRLAPQLQHYHHLKNGIRPHEMAFYAGVSEEDQEALKSPLGRTTYEAFEFANEADLRTYGVYDELTPLFQKLIGLA